MARVTVVVHACAAPAHLRDCLTSIARQSHEDLEVVVVADGSAEPALVVSEAAAHDDRFRVLHGTQVDVAEARNLGAVHASGDYLAFVDGSDSVPPHAYEAMLASLETTGSDFASGMVHVLGDSGSRPRQDLADVHARRRQRTHVSRLATLLRDRPVTNKLFRRSAWQAYGLRFTGLEDAEVALPAHVLARAVDVVPEPVSLVRPDTDAEPVYGVVPSRVLRSRLATIGVLSRFMAGHADPRTRLRFHEGVLTEELVDLLCVLDRATEEDQRHAVAAAARYLEGIPPDLLDRLPAIDRLTYHLAGRGLVAELVDVVELRRLGVRGTPVVRRRGRYYAAYPYLDDARLRIPRSVYELRDEMEPVAHVDRLGWRDGRLHVEGHAYVPGVGAPSPRRPRTVGLLRAEPRAGARSLIGLARRKVPLRMHRVHRPDVTADVYHPQESLDWSGFRLVIDPRRLVHGSAAGLEWRVELLVHLAGRVRKAVLRPPRGGGAGPTLQAEVGPGRRLQVGVLAQEGLSLRVENTAAQLNAHRVVDQQLSLRGTITQRQSSDRAVVRLRRRGEGTVHRLPLVLTGSAAPAECSADIPLGLLATRAGTHGFWDLAVTFGDGESWPLAAADGFTEGVYGFAADDEWPAGGEIVVDRTRDGNVRVRVRQPRPMLDEARWDGPVLRVSGVLPAVVSSPGGSGAGGHDMVVRDKASGQEYRWPLAAHGGRFTAAVTPFSTTSLAGTLPLAAGSWVIGIGRTGGDLTEDLQPLEVAEKLRGRFPITAELRRKEASLDVVRGRPVLRVTRDLELSERGGYRQQLLRTEAYPAWRREPPVDAVLYSSFNGLQYSDSPRAIHEELVRRDVSLEHLWVVKDGQVDLPPTARPVREDSREYYEALARARYVVVNDHLRQWFERRDDQVVVQTWHGTPLKALGLDLARTRPATDRYLDGLYRQTRSWQYVLSPNPYSTGILRSAYRLEGTLLEVGYPRNDIFFRPDRQEVAAGVRARLGIPEGKRVVLYAPTFRDHDMDPSGRHRLGLRLDLPLLRRALGDDHVLLVRKHRYVVGPVPGASDGFARDVSGYPDVAELLLVADVLVTDYSSVMFDFANTSRPMVFFTYDLEQYRDELRGMYVDFAAEAPGPLLTTSEQVAEAVRAADAVRVAHEHRYRPFAERYCGADDGRAAARVVDRVFAGELGLGADAAARAGR